MKVWLPLFLPFLSALGLCGEAAGPKIPILYSTDLFHPHDDPDDHYDLATLFALPEFDIKGVILDLGAKQKQKTGRPAVEQLMQITGRRVPVAIGLGKPLASRADTAADQPEEFQGGAKLILDTLRESREKIVLFSTGSCRDMAAAFNREPALFREKVRAYYPNVGNGPGETQNEYNVGLDGAAYERVFEMGAIVHWCPCYGKDGYATYYAVDQPTVVGACTPAVQNYFVYCLTRSKDDPLAFLAFGPHPPPQGKRNMWCTAPLLHAAGRQVYQRDAGDFIALQPADAEKAGLAGKAVEAYRFVPIRVTAGETKAPATRLAEPPPGKTAAAFWGRDKDKVGTHSTKPDGRADCCVRVLGLDAAKPIRDLVVTGPRDGRWELVETLRWWRVAYEREGSRLDCYFQFYAPGEHRIEIAYGDGTSQAATFDVPQVGGPALSFDLDAREPNAVVFRVADKRYGQIIGSCLRNLLEGLARDNP